MDISNRSLWFRNCYQPYISVTSLAGLNVDVVIPDNIEIGHKGDLVSKYLNLRFDRITCSMRSVGIVWCGYGR